MDVGRGTARNAAERPSVALCYPPAVEGGYSLIIDGDATVAGQPTVTFVPSGAVLHRPAPAGFGGSSTGCGNDCEPVGPSGDVTDAAGDQPVGSSSSSWRTTGGAD